MITFDNDANIGYSYDAAGKKRQEKTSSADMELTLISLVTFQADSHHYSGNGYLGGVIIFAFPLLHLKY